jgi:hypothetical protein
MRPDYPLVGAANFLGKDCHRKQTFAREPPEWTLVILCLSA